MSGYLPPGCTQEECDRAQGAYDEPPVEWHECPDCEGEGEVGTGRMSHSVDSATVDPPDEIFDQCRRCCGAGGWLDDARADA